MKIRLRGPGHAAGVLSELNRCRQSRQYCDAFLQVGTHTFAAHRAVLACAGTYFHNLFAGSLASPTASFSLEFISPANLEKVLRFIYTGEIFTDLIDVGVVYELAERLGVTELVRACHATFPDLQTSANCKEAGSGDILGSGIVPAAASTACSSTTSCSSLSSSATPTPAAAPSPVFSVAAGRADGTALPVVLPPSVKAEDVHSHLNYGRMAADHRPAGGSGPSISILPGGPVLQLKRERGPDVAGGSREGAGRGIACESDPAPSDCSFPDSSAQLDACDPTSSSGEQAGSLPGGAEGVQMDSTLTFGEVEDGAEEEQWRQLAVDIIELSDDENFMEEGDEEEDEDELVCVENGVGGASSSQVGGTSLACRACSVLLPADPDAIRGHAQTHLTGLGQCGLCGASFLDGAAGLAHALAHVGLQLFSCDMCHLQFCSQNKLLRHHRHNASSYTLPQGALTSGGEGPSADMQCAVCSKTLSKDFQTVKDHVVGHVCPQSLSCAVCHLPQPSLCSLLWHALAHLALPVFSCPHCARCFIDRPLLDRHMTAHAEEAVAKEQELGALRVGGVEEFHCFLCPQTFCSSSAFQHHLGRHTSDSQGAGRAAGGPGWLGKRKAEQSLEGPPSSCSSTSPRQASSMVKLSSLGLGLDLFPSMSSGVLTRGGAGQDGGAAGAGIRGKWYQCRYCSKRFAHSGEFTYHLRIHTGEKPYQCKVCLRFFRGRSTMISHLKTHAGALMYRCTVCSLYFSTLKLVSSHMELHKDHLPPDFTIEHTFMYNNHSRAATRFGHVTDPLAVCEDA